MHPLLWPDVARFGAATAFACLTTWLGFRIGNQYGRRRQRFFTILLFAGIVVVYYWLWASLLHGAQTIIGAVVTGGLARLCRRLRQAQVEETMRPGSWTERDAGYFENLANRAVRDQRRIPRWMAGLAVLWLVAWLPLVWSQVRPMRDVVVAVADVRGDSAATERLISAIKDDLADMDHVRVKGLGYPVDENQPVRLSVVLDGGKHEIVVWAEPEGHGWRNWTVMQAADSRQVIAAAKVRTQSLLWTPQVPRLRIEGGADAGLDDEAMSAALQAMTHYQLAEWQAARETLASASLEQTDMGAALVALSWANQGDVAAAQAAADAYSWGATGAGTRELLQLTLDHLAVPCGPLEDVPALTELPVSDLDKVLATGIMYIRFVELGPKLEVQLERLQGSPVAWLMAQRLLPVLLMDADPEALFLDAASWIEHLRLGGGSREVEIAVDALEAHLLMMQAQPKEAEELAKAALRMPGVYQSDGLAWAVLGDVSVERYESEKARRYLSRALEEGLPIEAEAMVRLNEGIVAVQEDEIEQALSLFAQARDLACAPMCRSEAAGWWGMVSYLSGNPSDGLTALDEALQMAPSQNQMARMYVMRAIALTSDNKSAAALEDLDHALELATYTSVKGWAHESRARLYAKMGYDDKVRDDLLKAQALGYDIPFTMREYLR